MHQHCGRAMTGTGKEGTSPAPRKWWGDCCPYSHISAPSRSPPPPQVLGLHYFYAITELGRGGRGRGQLSQAPCPSLRSCPQEAGVVGVKIPAPSSARGMGKGALVRSPGPSRVLGVGRGRPFPPLPHFQCCLDLKSGKGE